VRKLLVRLGGYRLGAQGKPAVKPNVVTIHLGRDDATGLIDPNAPVLIIAPDGSKHFGRLLPGEIDLFAGATVATFEVNLIDNTWRLIRRADVH
jgi:hypothetical protein